VKVCNVCKIEKAYKYFSKCKARKDGHSARCKSCDSQYGKDVRSGKLRVHKTEKTCECCKQLRSIDSYDEYKSAVDGRLKKCKECLAHLARQAGV